jgi:hypothetical protein
MNPELFWFGLVWTALLLWVLVGWCPLGPDGADTLGASDPGGSSWPRRGGAARDVPGGAVAAASQNRVVGG